MKFRKLLNNAKRYTRGDLNFLWWLGFCSGRIWERLNPNGVLSGSEESEYFQKDMERFLTYLKNTRNES